MGQFRKALQNTPNTTCVIIQFAEAILFLSLSPNERKNNISIDFHLLLHFVCLPCMKHKHESYYIQIFKDFAPLKVPRKLSFEERCYDISFVEHERLSVKLTSKISFVEMFSLIFEGIGNQTVVRLS